MKPISGVFEEFIVLPYEILDLVATFMYVPGEDEHRKLFPIFGKLVDALWRV